MQGRPSSVLHWGLLRALRCGSQVGVFLLHACFTCLSNAFQGSAKVTHVGVRDLRPKDGAVVLGGPSDVGHGERNVVQPSDRKGVSLRGRVQLRPLLPPSASVAHVRGQPTPCPWRPFREEQWRCGALSAVVHLRCAGAEPCTGCERPRPWLFQARDFWVGAPGA